MGLQQFLYEESGFGRDLFLGVILHDNIKYLTS